MSHTYGITNSQSLQANLNATDRTAVVKNNTANDPITQTLASQGSASTTTLSGAGTLLAASDNDDVRPARVAALKSAIDSGTYNVSAGAVADKLIASLLE